MDAHSFRRRQSPSTTADQRPEELFRVPEKRFGLFEATRIKGISSFLFIFPVLLLVVIIFRHDWYHQSNAFAEARFMAAESSESNVTLTLDDQPGSKNLSQPDEKLQGGLIVDGFHGDSCLSRYQSFLYRKASPYKPSSYLISKLRAYEELQRRCGPGSKPYAAMAGQLRSNHTVDSESKGCKYVVWMEFSGLGNRIISIASAFLYAILTDRVLLVEGGDQVSDLFCEPFPETSWLLPPDFPLLDRFNSYDQSSANCYGNILKKRQINSSSSSDPTPSHLYLHLSHDYSDDDKMFFCQEHQEFLKNVPWLIIRTNNYFVPSLFLIPNFKNELDKLFPEKPTVFHHLSRYLYHPSNQVWGLITRYYKAYLAKADERIGLQIRVFDEKSGVAPHVTRQIISCLHNNKLLPEISKAESVASPSQDPKFKTLMVTSLTTGYFEIIKNMYWENPTVTGEVVNVHQPSHEGHQKTEKMMHNRKAWAEMYLLSLTDELIISAWSTFGYVAQGLGGLKAWILYKPENQTTPDPPCRQAISIDPCFHSPPYIDCKFKKGIDAGNVVPYVKHCEDISWGVKLVDSASRL